MTNSPNKWIEEKKKEFEEEFKDMVLWETESLQTSGELENIWSFIESALEEAREDGDKTELTWEAGIEEGKRQEREKIVEEIEEFSKGHYINNEVAIQSLLDSLAQKQEKK